MIRDQPIQQYSDTTHANQGLFPFMRDRYALPSASLINVTSAAQFARYASRSFQNVYLYVYSSGRAGDVQILTTLLTPLLRNTLTKILLVDATQVPSVAARYSYGRPAGPVLAKLCRGTVLQFFTREWTYANVGKFIVADRKWRAQGFVGN